MKKVENLGDTLKAVGIVGLSEVEDIAGSIILGTAKTIKESTWEKKVILGGLVANLAAGLLDLDGPFAGIGAESIVGIDSFIDNTADIAIGAAAASLAYKAANNIQEINSSEQSADEILEELFGDNLETKEDNETIKITENKEKELFEQLLKKYGTKENL